MDFFKFHLKNKMIDKKKIFELLDVESRKKMKKYPKHNLAASVQHVLEKALTNLFCRKKNKLQKFIFSRWSKLNCRQ